MNGWVYKTLNLWKPTCSPGFAYSMVVMELHVLVCELRSSTLQMTVTHLWHIFTTGESDEQSFDKMLVNFLWDKCVDFQGGDVLWDYLFSKSMLTECKVYFYPHVSLGYRLWS